MKGIRQAYFNRQNWFGGLYTSLMNLPLFLFGAFGVLYLTQIRHLSLTHASWATSLMFLGTTIGSPLAGWISDQMGVRKRPMIIGGLISLAIVLIIMLAPVLSLNQELILFFALGLISSTQVISYPIVAESNPEFLTASSVSVVSISCIAGGFFGEPLFGRLMSKDWSGLIVDHIRIYSSHDYLNALLILPIGFIIALAVLFMMRETHCKRI